MHDVGERDNAFSIILTFMETKPIAKILYHADPHVYISLHVVYWFFQTNDNVPQEIHSVFDERVMEMSAFFGNAPLTSCDVFLFYDYK